jgi:hypothetical protein
MHGRNPQARGERFSISKIFKAVGAGALLALGVQSLYRRYIAEPENLLNLSEDMFNPSLIALAPPGAELSQQRAGFETFLITSPECTQLAYGISLLLAHCNEAKDSSERRSIFCEKASHQYINMLLQNCLSESIEELKLPFEDKPIQHAGIAFNYNHEEAVRDNKQIYCEFKNIYKGSVKTEPDIYSSPTFGGNRNILFTSAQDRLEDENTSVAYMSGSSKVFLKVTKDKSDSPVPTASCRRGDNMYLAIPEKSQDGSGQEKSHTRRGPA